MEHMHELVNLDAAWKYGRPPKLVHDHSVYFDADHDHIDYGPADYGGKLNNPIPDDLEGRVGVHINALNGVTLRLNDLQDILAPYNSDTAMQLRREISGIKRDISSAVHYAWHQLAE